MGRGGRDAILCTLPTEPASRPRVGCEENGATRERLTPVGHSRRGARAPGFRWQGKGAGCLEGPGPLSSPVPAVYSLHLGSTFPGPPRSQMK